MSEVIRVVQFADIVNAHDFIDNIIQHADPARFHVGVCVRSEQSHISAPVFAERTPRWMIGGGSKTDWPRIVWRLARLLRRWDAHILHTHHYEQAVLGWLATRLHTKTRLVVGRHYSDAIYRSRGASRRRVLLALEQAVNRAATRIVVPSSMIYELLTKRQGIDADKIDLIHYGFAPEKYEPPYPEDVRRVRAEFDLEGRVALATFARLHEEKGHRYLVEAMAALKQRVPGIRYLIVGEGPEREAVERQVRELKLEEDVRLLGWRRDTMTVMAASDIVVQPTLHEAFSQVMCEALWMRKPLVITDVSGATDIVRNGENGLLVPQRDAAALAVAVERLAKDESLRLRLGRAGHELVTEHLSIDKIICRYEDAYVRALSIRERE